MKNAVFWDVIPRGFRKNRRFGETYIYYILYILYTTFLRSMLRLLVTAKLLPKYKGRNGSMIPYYSHRNLGTHAAEISPLACLPVRPRQTQEFLLFTS
jgi:hypothetical protein